MRSFQFVCWLLFGLAACAEPPPDAFLGGSAAASSATAVALGTDTAGEACTQQVRNGGADIFCGSWAQPSARVERAQAGSSLARSPPPASGAAALTTGSTAAIRRHRPSLATRRRWC